MNGNHDRAVAAPVLVVYAWNLRMNGNPWRMGIMPTFTLAWHPGAREIEHRMPAEVSIRPRHLPDRAGSDGARRRRFGMTPYHGGIQEYGTLNRRARFGGVCGEGEPPGEPRLGRSLALPRRMFAHGHLDGRQAARRTAARPGPRPARSEDRQCRFRIARRARNPLSAGPRRPSSAAPIRHPRARSSPGGPLPNSGRRCARRRPAWRAPRPGRA